MKSLAAAVFAGLVSLAASAQIPSPSGMKDAIKVKADSAVDTGKDTATTKADEAKATAETKTDAAKASVDAKAANVPLAGDKVKGATGAASEKGKAHAKKAHAGARGKTTDASGKAHKKVDELAK